MRRQTRRMSRQRKRMMSRQRRRIRIWTLPPASRWPSRSLAWSSRELHSRSVTRPSLDPNTCQMRFASLTNPISAHLALQGEGGVPELA
jgi:hypothetical protein